VAKRNKQTVIQERWEKKMAKGRQVKESDNYVHEPVQARNEKQKEFLKQLNTKSVCVFNSPAGCGKSYLTMCEATDWLKKGYFDKITISRPNVIMGRTLGALRGDLAAKFEPLVMPLLEVVKRRYGHGFYESCLHNGTIELAPLEYIRGRNFSEVVIIDEAQLTTPEEMYTILTRLEEGGKLILIGDPTQKDQKGMDGITWLMDFVKRHNMEDLVGYVEGSSDDIERGSFCKRVVKAMEKDREHGRG
jgi:phosphate starvation-inducible PhoH-like protein